MAVLYISVVARHTIGNELICSVRTMLDNYNAARPRHTDCATFENRVCFVAIDVARWVVLPALYSHISG